MRASQRHGLLPSNMEHRAIKQPSAQAIRKKELTEANIVSFIDELLADAVKRGASDIHFEPYEHYYRIRLRLDGLLTAVAQPPLKLAKHIAARLKVLSNLDLAERRLPQDGRFKQTFAETEDVDFRISTCPTLFGEKIVLRILDRNNKILALDALGMSNAQQIQLQQAIAQPQGLVLVTGPTGSGKTITLYTCLTLLNQIHRNISTVEDPVEINLPGINQVHVNLKTGLSFATALRAFLRQDPDSMMVGEIRDLETAEIAIKAAQTGHLVLSTLHTNSAAETLTRLLNMGLAPFNLASSIRLVVAQRLVRRLCPSCKQTQTLPPTNLLEYGFQTGEIADLRLYEAGACERCQGGYKGRIGIYEVLPISEAIERIILHGGNAQDIAAQAEQAGVQNLRRSGLEAAKHGITSLAEINRVI